MDNSQTPLSRFPLWSVSKENQNCCRKNLWFSSIIVWQGCLCAGEEENRDRWQGKGGFLCCPPTLIIFYSERTRSCWLVPLLKIWIQILDWYINSLRRYAVVSASGFFTVILPRIRYLRSNIESIYCLIIFCFCSNKMYSFGTMISLNLFSQVNRGLVTSFFATTVTYLVLLLQYSVWICKICVDFTSLALALEIDVSWKTTLLHSSFINVQFAPIQKATVKEGVTFVFVFVFVFVIVFVFVFVSVLVPVGVISDILELPAFRKYSMWWVF